MRAPTYSPKVTPIIANKFEMCISKRLRFESHNHIRASNERLRFDSYNCIQAFNPTARGVHGPGLVGSRQTEARPTYRAGRAGPLQALACPFCQSNQAKSGRAELFYYFLIVFFNIFSEQICTQLMLGFVGPDLVGLRYIHAQPILARARLG